MLEPLANRTAPSLNAQKCSDPNGLGLKKRGAPVCDGTDCVIVNGIMALIAANAMVEYAGYWMYVSNIPPENMPNDLEPGWMEMENYALVNELFPALDPSDAKQMAILTNISKFFFGLASKLHREPDAVPTVVTVTWSEITCSSQPTSSIAVTSTRSCPKISATFTSPVTTVSTFVCPSTVLV